MANSVYWVGADGNVYLKGPNGVQNAGKALGTSPVGFDAARLSAEATQIPDPNPPRQVAPANPNGGTSTGGTTYADKSNDIALQNAGLASLGDQTATGIAGVDKALGNLTGQYDTEAAANEKNYSTQSDTNQNNLQKDRQTALVNAAQGRRGLFGTLASLGALNGSGVDLANEAVRAGANADLSGAADTFSTNQNALDTSIGEFRQEDKRRRQEAATAAENAKTNVQNDAARNKVTFLTNLANDYTAQGDTAAAKRYADQAAALYPEIAKTNVPSSNIAYSGAAFTPSTLSSYLSGANNTTVSTTPSTPGFTIPGLVASTRKKQLQPA